MNNEEVTDSLNDILGYVYDSYNGYKECADVVADETMKNLFSILGTQRESMIKELAKEIKALGTEPVQSGSAIGAAHRLFVDLKSLVTGGGTEAIINEVKRGENTLINSYKDVLKKDLPAPIRTILTHQLENIERNLIQIDTLSIASNS